MSSAISVLASKKKKRARWIDTVSYWFRPYELLTEEEEKAGKIPRFRALANAVETWGLQALLLLALPHLLPGFWKSQTHAGMLVLLATTFAVGILVVAPFEWFFHRFAMHQLLAFQWMKFLRVVPETGRNRFVDGLIRVRNSITIKITYHVAKMSFGHGAHHKITDVTPINPTRLAEFFDVLCKYEINSNERTEHAVFPHFSVLGFWFFLLPVGILLQTAANIAQAAIAPHSPHLPMVLSLILALTWQVWLYEYSHAVMHQPYATWWKPRIKLPIVGRWFSKVYRFHFFHHMNENSSLGVVGAVWFWYVWDRLFGTYKLARLELIESASTVTSEVLEMSREELRLLPGANAEDFAAPVNKRRWVQYLDAQSAKARANWNQLFIASLEEVRRRRASVQA